MDAAQQRSALKCVCYPVIQADASKQRGNTVRRLYFVTRRSKQRGYPANVAQMVEQLTRNEQVSGSIPLVGSRRPAPEGRAWSASIVTTSRVGNSS
jgi:hypothetical protein